MREQSSSKSKFLTNTALSTAVAAAALIFAAQAAEAGVLAPVQASHVEDNGGVNIGGGVISYEFTVFNDGASGDVIDEYGYAIFSEPLIVDWELPYFNDPGAIFNVRSPDGWTFAIEEIGTANAATGWDGTASWQDPGDPFYFGDDSPFTTVTQVLHWYLEDWAAFGSILGAIPTGECGYGEALTLFAVGTEVPCNALAGFGFDSFYGATAAPYQASWDFLEVQSGDPAFPLAGLPGSPSVVPEPESGILLATGLIALGGFLGRRRRRKS